MMRPLFVILTLFCMLKVLKSAPTDFCSDGDVRLVNGGHTLQGRLEICVNETWGTVCNDGFDTNEAKVVCRQLGIRESALSDVITNIYFGGGQTADQSILLDEVRCSGTEQNLLQCPHQLPTGSHNCFHPEDIGVICQRSQDCTDDDIRLVDGDNYNATEGRVEYCVGGRWGTVCNFEFGDEDAAVVCRQLGLNTLEPKALTDSVPQVTNQATPIVVDFLTCRSTELSLSECDRASNVEFCEHSDDAGAFCTNIIECVDGNIRLVGAEALNRGRVEFCASGRWGIVCFDRWDSMDATVVCRQLGYEVKGVAINTALPTTDFVISLKYVNCNGSESTLSQCPQSDMDCLDPGAGVICPLGGATTFAPETTYTMDTLQQTTPTEQATEAETTTRSNPTTPPSPTIERGYTTQSTNVFNVTVAPGRLDDLSGTSTNEAPFLIAVLLVVTTAIL